MSVWPGVRGVTFRKATHEGSRQRKPAGTSPSIMRVNTVAKRRSSFRDQYSVATMPDAGSPEWH